MPRETVAVNRQWLLAGYRAALKVINGEQATRQALGELFASHAPEQPVYLIAIGKAALAMAAGAHQALGEQIKKALVISKHSYLTEHPTIERQHWQLVGADHPLPSESSLTAGHTLLNFLAEIEPRSTTLFLISGGTSSLVEVLQDSLTLDDLARVNHWLLGAGLGIDAMNAVRSRLSKIKAGGLWQYINSQRVIECLMSDVPGDDPAIIGSGLLHPRTTSPGDIKTSSPTLPPLSPLAQIAQVPEWIELLLNQAQIQSTESKPKTKHEHDAFGHQAEFCHQIVANNQLARQAITDFAHQYQIPVFDQGLITDDVFTAANMIFETLQQGKEGLYVWGGEVAVSLPENPGDGGRCQMLAMLLSEKLAGCDNLIFMAASTDGWDGTLDDAGALIDGKSFKRAEDAGYNFKHCVDRANANQFLTGSGDLIHTGPTNANVMDLYVGLKWSAPIDS